MDDPFRNQFRRSNPYDQRRHHENKARDGACYADIEERSLVLEM